MMTAADDRASYRHPRLRRTCGHLIFETVAEAQTSVDPTKPTRAVEKFAAETRREIDLGFARGSYACALCAAHYANRLAPAASGLAPTPRTLSS
jgi:hypothetical protein